MMSNCGWLLVGLICLLPVAACSQSPPKLGQPTETRPTNSSKPDQSGKGLGDRIVIPDLKGCTRDQTTLYRGKVIFFRRTPKSTEITVRTEWDTTEKLIQPHKSGHPEYRLRGRAMTDSELKDLEAQLKDLNREARATVWVCLINKSESIKIIDWESVPSEASR